MRIFILLCSFLLSHATWAETANYHNPFASSSTNFALAAATSLATPFTQSQLLQADILHNSHATFANQGVMLSIPNRRVEYLQANPYGAQGRQRIAEEIGDWGTQLYARKMNFQPLFEGKAGQGQGFDAVYRTNKQVIVVEAKGGSSQPKIYRGYQQGTREYTLKVAEYVQNSKTATAAAKQAAKAVIQAHKDGNLVVQVARTRHVYGTARPTQVETTYGKLEIPSTLQVAHRLSLGAGLMSAVIAGGFDIVAQSVNGQYIDLKRVMAISALGGFSGYAGNLSGTLLSNRLLLHATLSPAASNLAGSLTGGATTSVLLAYGLYLLGYSDLNSANRSMTAGLIGTAAGGFATAGLMALATTVGTASTGTAIASLSGVAAHHAALAWLGGGALSAGGAGMAGGAMVLSGGALLAVVGASAAVMYLFQKGDEQTEQQRVEYLLASVKQRQFQKR